MRAARVRLWARGACLYDVYAKAVLPHAQGQAMLC